MVMENDQSRYVPWEYEYIASQIGGPHVTVFQSLLKVKDRSVDRIVAQEPDGNLHAFYFDVTGPMRASEGDLKRAWEEMKARGEVPPELMED